MTKGGIGDRHFDLATKADIFQSAFERYFKKAKLEVGGKAMTYAKAFVTSTMSQGIVGIGGGIVHGLLRRFDIQGNKDNGIHENAGAVIWKAVKVAKKDNKDFGVDFHIPSCSTLPSYYVPDASITTLQIEELLREERRKKREKAVVIPKPKPIAKIWSSKRAAAGPCVFGHLSTSAKDSKAKPRWHVAPAYFQGTSAGDVLCQLCYERLYNATKKGKMASIPQTPSNLHLVSIPRTPCGRPGSSADGYVPSTARPPDG